MAAKNTGSEQNKTTQLRNKTETGRLVTYFFIFVFGFVSGIAFTAYKGSSPESTSSTVAVGQSQTQKDETSQAIKSMEAEVAANPDNFQSWIRLGHLYYDSDQPEKAISAYNKSLELHSGDANLLTDLGVMYRRANQPKKAIELFNQAIQKDPDHEPSRFNKGIVLMYDLHDTAGALAAWEELLRINPQAKTANGQSIRELVETVKAESAGKK